MPIVMGGPWVGGYFGSAEVGITATGNLGAGGNNIKWHPGHYEISDNGASLAERLVYIDELEGESAVLGLSVRYFWADFESTEGVYDFSTLTSLLTRSELRGKRLMLELWTRKFGTSSQSGIVPDYIRNIDGPDTGLFPTSGGFAAKIWDSRIMDRLIALWEAMALVFDAEPKFEMISPSETAQGNGTAGTGYTAAKFVTQNLRLMVAGRAAWPKTNLRYMGNFLTSGSNAQAITLMEGVKNNQWTIGGPDIFGGSFTTFQQIFRGTIGGHDYRGEVGSAFQIEVTSLQTSTLQALYDRGIDDLSNNYFPWLRFWVTPTWNDDILPFLQSNPTTLSTPPTGWTVDTS